MKSKINSVCTAVIVGCVTFALLSALPVPLKVLFVLALVINYFTGETE